jgi:hypothetical protein
MNEEGHSDLFEIRINETSKKIIRKIYPLISISFILNILLALIIICISIYSFREYDHSINGSPKRLYLFIYPFYSIVYSIIATVGGYFYFLFLKKLKWSVVNSDENAFNSSFKYVYRNAVLFLISLTMAFLFTIFEVIAVFT